MANYDISQAAIRDLYKIWEYTVDTWSEEQADIYYGMLKTGIDRITRMPQSTGFPFDEITSGLRGYHVGRHVIFFDVQPNGRVRIIRILHERMDYSRHLFME